MRLSSARIPPPPLADALATPIRPRPWLRRALWALIAVYWVVLFVLTHIPPRNLTGPQINDKIAHFVAYGLLGGLLFVTLWMSRPRLRHIGLITIALGTGYGIVDELSQAPVGRTCSGWDLLADVAGLVLAAGLLTWTKRRIEKSLRARLHATTSVGLTA